MTDQNDAAFTAPGDSLLKLLVKMANGGGSFPLTLLVGGHVVSGTLISKRTYLDAFVNDLTTGFSDESKNSIRASFGLDEAEISPGDDDEGDSGGPSPDPAYVHLINAKVYSPGQAPMPTNGMTWRGRISEVAGFSYGTFASN